MEFENRQNKNAIWIISHVHPINIPIQGIQSESVPPKINLKPHYRQFNFDGKIQTCSFREGRV